MKRKLLIINTALAPYMIDQYNDLNQLFDVEVVFLFPNVLYDKFNQSQLLAKLTCRYSFLLKGPVYKDRVFRFGILKAIRRVQPDFIISYEYSFTTQYLLLLKRLGIIHQKIGSTIDDSLEICNNVQSKIREAARAFAVKKLDFHVVLSDDISQFYKDKFGLKENEIVISPILQNPDRLRKNSEEIESIANDYLNKFHLKGKKILLYVGRFVEAKGLVPFLNNACELLNSEPNIVFVLVGDGEEKKGIETIFDDKRLYDKLLMPGRFENEELYAWYACASGFVLPSIYEPYGAVVNESLIFGTKVFCSEYAGSASLINHDNGMIFNPLDKDHVIEKFKLFLSRINVVENINMNKKPTLITNKNDEFINEWKKISNE